MSRLWIVTLALLLLTGCATGSVPSSPPANIAGVWEGNWSGQAGHGQVKVELKQEGAYVTGTIWAGGAVLSGGSSEVSGLMYGNEFDGRFFAGGSSASLLVKVKSDSAEGSVIAGGTQNQVTLRRVR